MISGPDPKILDALADQVVERFNTVRGLTTVTRSWTGDKTEYLMKINVEKAGR